MAVARFSGSNSNWHNAGMRPNSYGRMTNSDRIIELEKLVATLTARVDSILQLKVDKADFAVVEERLNELKKRVEEAEGRRWSIWPAVIGGVIGAVLGFLGQLLLKK